VKLLGHRPGLPGKVILFHIVPLDPAYKTGLARHVPVASLKASKKEKESRKANSLADWIKKML
jgi:hypothetical protein